MRGHWGITQRACRCEQALRLTPLLSLRGPRGVVVRANARQHHVHKPAMQKPSRGSMQVCGTLYILLCCHVAWAFLQCTAKHPPLGSIVCAAASSSQTPEDDVGMGSDDDDDDEGGEYGREAHGEAHGEPMVVYPSFPLQVNAYDHGQLIQRTCTTSKLQNAPGKPLLAKSPSVPKVKIM